MSEPPTPDDLAIQLRQRAEVIAREPAAQPPPDSEAGLPAATRRALHELRVHQIELELQNEELRRAQVALDAARERYFDLYTLAPVGYCTLSERGLILEANLTAAHLLGRAPKGLIGWPFSQFILPEDGSIYARLRRELQTTGTPQACELRLVPAGGEPCWVQLAASAGQAADGATMSRVVLTDITERKRAGGLHALAAEILRILNDPLGLPDALQRILAAIRRATGLDAVGLRLRQGDDFPYCTADGFSPEFLRAENHLAARTPEGGLCRDEQGKVRLECTCGLVLSGHTDPTNPLFTPGGSAWTNDARPLLHVPADQDPRLHPRNRCIHEGFQSVALIPIRANREIVGLLQLNDCRRGRFTLELVQFFEGIAASLGGAVARTQLEDQNRQLQKAESLGRMAGAIAHHFNNQLQAVLLNLELAQRDRPGPATPSAHLAVALQSAHKAAEVSGLMLTYLGQTTAQHAPLDLCVACQQSLLLVRAALPGGVVLETDWPAPGPTVSSNTHQLQQVLTCLLTNAWEALTDAPGSIRLSVRTVSAAAIPTPHRFPVGWQPQAQDYACLEVADTGGGIAGPALDNVFDPFFSTKPTSRGLGLSVVLGLVRAHDGAITVESQPGCGSVFRVFLPRSTTALARRPQLEVPARPAPGSGTVLVVDDEPVIRETVALALKRFGFTVLQAHDGVAALEVFGQHPEEIRCVLCDLTMPRMGGWETLLALRKLRPGLPVILSSGYSEEQALAGQHPELPQAFLRKPYEVKTLYAVVTQALASRPDGAPLEPKPGIGPQVVSKSCR